MIGQLPTSIHVNGKEIPIDTDFRTALMVFVAFNAPDLNDDEQYEVMLRLLIPDFNDIKQNDIRPAINECIKFLNAGDTECEEQSRKAHKIRAPKLMDWEQDEQMIMSAVNKVAGKEVRCESYMHWWTFLGYFRERGECLLNAVISIRDKRAKRTKLTKEEQEFFEANKAIIVLHDKMDDEEKAEIERLRRIARGR